MNVAVTKIAARTLLLAGVFALAVLASFMRGGGPGITFALENGINLTIGSAAFYNGLPVSGSTWELKDLVPGVDKFFNLEDVMPGDSGQAGITMRVGGRESAWLCLDFKNLVSDENGLIEPENDADANGAISGELADSVEFFAWRDDGDGVFEVGEQTLFGTGAAGSVLNNTTYALADASIGTPLEDGDESNIGIAWCAGDLSVALDSAQIACIPSLGNAAQTDSFSVDVAIRAEGTRERGTFTCAGGFEDVRGRPERPPRPERPTRPNWPGAPNNN